MQVLKHSWSRRLDVDFVVSGPTGQPMHAPVWQSMWACVQSDLREARTAYASPTAQTEFIDFGWSMPHLDYQNVEQVHLSPATHSPARYRMSSHMLLAQLTVKTCHGICIPQSKLYQEIICCRC